MKKIYYLLIGLFTLLTLSINVSAISDINYASINIESDILGLFIVFLVFSLAFSIDDEEKKNIWKPILMFLDTPIALAVGISYLGNSIFSIGWWIGVTMFLFAIILSFAGLYYGLKFGRRD